MAQRKCETRRDPCVVPTDQLAQLVQPWVDTYEQRRGLRDTRGKLNLGRGCRRDENGYFQGRSDDAPISGVTALARETALVAHGGEGLHPDKIRRILKGEHRSTELRIADLLVTAIRRPEAFYDGSLTVSPNPRSDQRGECCGNLNGAAAPPARR